MQKRMSNNVLLLILKTYVLVSEWIYWGNPSPKPPGADGKRMIYNLKVSFLLLL